MTTSTVIRRKRNERGATLILTALVLPVIVLFTGLGIGGAVVRSASDETQRTADLSALAASSSVPTLGRPLSTGLPSVPSDYQLPLPPLPQQPPNPNDYVNGSVYDNEYAAASATDNQIAAHLGVGPIAQSAIDSIGSPWPTGCNVAEAQYTVGRAKMGRAFALDGNGGKLVPRCAVTANGTTSFPNGEQRIYIRPEMESTGAYRLQTCLVDPTHCANFLGEGTVDVLSDMGKNTVKNLPIPSTDPAACLVDPSAPGCFFDPSTLEAMGVPVSQAQATVAGLQAQFESVTGVSTANLPASVRSDLESLASLLLGQVNPANACKIDLGVPNPVTGGWASGQRLCEAGVNLASLLPSTMTPRVRSIVHHCIDIPLVPSLAGADCGDFSFTSQALARRTFKNAVVVPTIPGSFTVDPSASATPCLLGQNLLGALGLLPTLATLQTAVSAVGSLPSANQCPEVNTDAVPDVSPNTGQKSIDLNPVLAQQQSGLITAASAVNAQANDGANQVIAAALNHEDGGTRTAADCENGKTAQWCVDLGGQQIQDMKDLYSPPSGEQAPSATDIFKGAAQSGDPITMVSLGKYVTVNISPAIHTPNAGTVSALTYWIPALDVVPVTVSCFFDATSGNYVRNPTDPQHLQTNLPCDPAHPSKSTYKVINSATGPQGLYRGVLIDAHASYPLCTASPATNGNCVDQPNGAITLPSPPPIPPVTTTTTVTIPSTTTTSVTLPSTTTTTSPPSTTTTLLPPITTPTTTKLGLP